MLDSQVWLCTFGGRAESPVLRFYMLFCLDASHSGTVGNPALPHFPPACWKLQHGGRIPWESPISLQQGPSQTGLSSSSNPFGLQQSSGGGLFKALVLFVGEVGSASSL